MTDIIVFFFEILQTPQNVTSDKDEERKVFYLPTFSIAKYINMSTELGEIVRDMGRGKLQYSEKTLFQCPWSNKNITVTGLRSKADFPGYRPATTTSYENIHNFPDIAVI